MKYVFILLFLSISVMAFISTPPIKINRILKSGNGKSIETAYKVDSVEEEYDLLRFLKLNLIMQKLYIKKGYFYDTIITNKNTIYFKIVTKKLNTKSDSLAI
jgi:hypothetical protein